MIQRSKRTLITGGAGFIGLHLASHLLDKGERVVLVDNFFRAKNDADLKALLRLPNVTLIRADLTKPEELKKLGSGYDYVYHLAAVNGTKLFYEMPHEVLRINVASLMNVLDWFIRKNRNGKILFTSSNEAYAGALEAFGRLPLPTPEKVPLVIADVANPRWTYAGTKLIGEQFFIHFAKHYGFRMSIVRPHNFYGPRAGWNHVIPEFATRATQRIDPFPLYGANEKRSFCYIEDAVAAMRLVMLSKKTDGGTYHIGSHQELSMRQVAQAVFAAADWHPKKLEIHLAPAGSVKRRIPDIRSIGAAVGWKPKTSFEDGLRTTYAWYREQLRGKVPPTGRKLKQVSR